MIQSNIGAPVYLNPDRGLTRMFRSESKNIKRLQNLGYTNACAKESVLSSQNDPVLASEMAYHTLHKEQHGYDTCSECRVCGRNEQLEHRVAVRRRLVEQHLRQREAAINARYSRTMPPQYRNSLNAPKYTSLPYSLSGSALANDGTVFTDSGDSGASDYSGGRDSAASGDAGSGSDGDSGTLNSS